MKNKEEVKSVSDIDIMMSGTKLAKATSNLGSDVKHLYSMGIPLDCILGGGVSSGKIIEVYGRESHGKSALALEMAKAFQKYWRNKGRKGVVLWIESESVFDKLRAKRFGLDIDSTITVEIDIVEDGFELIETQCKKSLEHGIPLFIVWDTIASTISRSQKVSNNIFGGGRQEKPRLIKFWLEVLTKLLGDSSTTLVLVNQVYEGEHGDITPGGLGIRFHASIRISVRKEEEIKEVLGTGMDVTKGIVTGIKTVKNKIVLPGISLPIVLYGETGIDYLDTLVRYFKVKQIVKVGGGGWMTIAFNGTEYRFQSVKKLREIIETQEPKLQEYMEYLAYKSFSEISVLLKVKYYKILLKYEQDFKFPETILKDDELELASYLYKDIQNLNIKEDGSTEIIDES